MATSASLQSPIAIMLELLRKLHPPQSLIHVGAGKGTGEMQAWHGWNIDNAWIIDANPDCLQWAETLASSHPGWHVICAILCDDHEKATWHHASNPDEHSLISPDQLKPIWPNLQATSQEERITQGLDNVLVDCGAIPDASWLFIDCLPALPILKGAGQCLDHCSVLWLRVLLKPLAEINEKASLTALEKWLQPLGYRCIEFQESNHPALGHALFVRNWQSMLQTQKEKLAAENQEQARLATQRQRQIDELIKNHTNDKDQHVTLIAELQRRLTALAAKLDRHTRLATDHQQLMQELAGLKAVREQEKSVLDSRTKERDEQTKLAAERQARLDELGKINEAQKRQISNIETQLTELQQQLQDLKKSKQELEQEKAILETQREQMQQDVAKLTKSMQANGQEKSALVAQREQMQKEITNLTKSKQALEQEKTALETQREQMQKEITNLTKSKQALEREKTALADHHEQIQKEIVHVTEARDQQAKLANQRQNELLHVQEQAKQQVQRIAQLQNELTERDVRQQMLNDEMTRAEAQIDLIKDVLFREPGL